jgi:Ca2+-binding RTX toxin-like protein
MAVSHIKTNQTQTVDLTGPGSKWAIDKGVVIDAPMDAGVFIHDADDLSLLVNGTVVASDTSGISVAGIETTSDRTDIRVGKNGDVSGVYGIYIKGDDTHVVNDGKIHALALGMGITAQGHNYRIENNALIKSPFSEAIYTTSGGTIINHEKGRMVGETGMWINSTEDVTVVNKGRIIGDGWGVLTGAGDDHITNRGFLKGQIGTGDGDDRIDLRGGTLIGLAGGGGGHDTYRIDDSDVALYESDGKGTDTVSTSVSYALMEDFGEIEILVGQGRRNITLYGNSQDNMIIGNDGNNRLYGGDGADALYSGAGKDRMTGGADIDTFVFRRDEGRDRITDFDFEGMETDVIDLHFLSRFKSFDDVLAYAVEASGGVVLSLGKGDSVLIEDTTLNDLHENQFSYFT